MLKRRTRKMIKFDDKNRADEMAESKPSEHARRFFEHKAYQFGKPVIKSNK